MDDWKTLREVAEELGISKDLVKYHRKNLNEFQLKQENGRYYISLAGVEVIRSRLTKESYDATFEEKVLRRLNELKSQQDIIYRLLLQLLTKDN